MTGGLLEGGVTHSYDTGILYFFDFFPRVLLISVHDRMRVQFEGMVNITLQPCITLPWLYFTLLSSTLLNHGFTSHYLTLCMVKYRLK